MEDRCKVCKKWQNHFYWRHMDPTKVKFFVKMETSFRRSLNFPRNFAKNFKGKISKIVKLKVSSGKTWQIEVHRSENTIVLRSGWRDFVTANRIDENDHLVFKYCGSSSFDVLIFDPSGHEKTVLPVIKNEETKSESESETEIESESETEETSSDSDTYIRLLIPPKKMKSNSEISSPDIKAKKKRGGGGEGTSRFVRKKENQALSEKPYHVPSNLELSVAQENIADNIACATHPGSKLFLKILCSTDLTHYLTIPRDFARQNLGQRSQSVSLLLAYQAKVFTAQYRYNKSTQWLGCGWREFTLKNNLKEGDLCLFEVKMLDDADQFAVVVYVLPKAISAM